MILVEKLGILECLFLLTGNFYKIYTMKCLHLGVYILQYLISLIKCIKRPFLSSPENAGAPFPKRFFTWKSSWEVLPLPPGEGGWVSFFWRNSQISAVTPSNWSIFKKICKKFSPPFAPYFSPKISDSRAGMLKVLQELHASGRICPPLIEILFIGMYNV